MISSIENGELNAPVALSTFIPKLEEVGNEIRADEEKAKIELGNKDSFWGNMEAATRTNFTGASSFLNMVERKHVLTKNYTDESFTDEEKLSVLKQSMVRPEGYEEILSANNRELFAEKINDVNKFYEASDKISSMGLGEALAYSALPAIADVPSWVVGGVIGKTAKGLEFINKTTGLTNTALKVAAGGLTVGTAVGVSEKLIQMESGVDDEKRLNEAIMFGTALGAGGSALFPTIMGIGSVTKQAATSQAVQKALTPVNDFFRKHLTLSTVEQLKISDTSTDLLKDIANKADDAVYATYDHNGDLVASELTAMGYRSKHADGNMYNINRQVVIEAKKAGMSPTDYARQLELDKREHSRVFEDAKEERLIKMTKEEQLAKYKENIGQDYLPFEKEIETKTADLVGLTETRQKAFDEQVSTISTNLVNRQVKEAKSIYINHLDSMATINSKIIDINTKLETTGMGSGFSTKNLDDIKILEGRRQELEFQKAELDIKTQQLEAAVEDAKNLRTPMDKIHKQANSRLSEIDKQIKELTESIATTKTKVEIPEDFYQVIKAGIGKEIKHLYPAPAHLKFIDDAYKTVRELADDAQLRGVAGKDDFGYHHIKYDLGRMMSDGQQVATARINEMLLDTPLARDMLAKGEATLEDFAKEADRLYSVAQNQDLNHKYLGKGSGGSTSATKFRRLSMNTRLYPEYFSNNIALTMTEYMDNMVGKLAAKKFFNLESDSSGSIKNSIDKLLRDEAKKGASKADLDNTLAIIETVLGTRRMQKDPHKIDNMVGRISRKTAGALYNAGFSKYTLAEIGSVIGKFGLINTINNFIPAHKMMLESISKMEPTNPNIKYFTNMGLAGQVIKAVQHDRFDAGEIVPYVGKGEEVLDNINHLGRKVSFFNHLQDTVDFMAGGSYLTNLMDIVESGRTMSKAESEMFSRYGILAKDIKKMQGENILYHPNSKVVQDYNFYNWNDKDLGNKVLNSLQAAVKDTIVRTDGTRIHRYQSEVNGIFKPLFFQFSQFPVAAFERMLLNTNEVTARSAVGIGASATIMYGMLELEDAALVAAGVKDRRMSSDDLMLKALLRTPQAGLAQSVWDIPATAVGLTTSSGYQGQAKFPVGAGAQAVGNVFTGTIEGTKAFLEGDFEKGIKMYGKSTPIVNSLSGLNIFWKSATGQTTKERGDGSNIFGNMNQKSAYDRIMEEHKDYEKYMKGIK